MILMAADWGTIPQQVTAVSASGLFVSMLGILAKLMLGKGQLINASEADIRDHYAEELAALRKERADDKAEFARVERHLRDMASESDRRHSECESARAEDRRERSRMQDEIDGLKRQVPELSADKLMRLEGKPSEIAPHAAASAERVKKITEERDK